MNQFHNWSCYDHGFGLISSTTVLRLKFNHWFGQICNGFIDIKLWAWWVGRRKLQNPAGDQEHKVIESCQQESGNVAIEGQKRTSFPERSRTFNRRECSRKPQPSRTLDNALFSKYLNPCLFNPLQWMPGRKARTTSDSLAVSPTSRDFQNTTVQLKFVVTSPHSTFSSSQNSFRQN